MRCSQCAKYVLKKYPDARIILIVNLFYNGTFYKFVVHKGGRAGSTLTEPLFAFSLEVEPAYFDMWFLDSVTVTKNGHSTVIDLMLMSTLNSIKYDRQEVESAAVDILAASVEMEGQINRGFLASIAEDIIDAAIQKTDAIAFLPKEKKLWHLAKLVHERLTDLLEFEDTGSAYTPEYLSDTIANKLNKLLYNVNYEDDIVLEPLGNVDDEIVICGKVRGFIMKLLEKEK